MKGIVFTEFLTMVENKFGFETADKLITETELESGGVYTAVGTYSHAELVQLIMGLSKESGVAPDKLQEAFGEYLFPRFFENYGALFEGITDSLSMLEKIEDYIHVEVLKLYPDAELPKFETKRLGEHELEMIYRSSRRMAPFAVGLINACSDHFKEPLEVNLKDNAGDGSEVVFHISRSAA